MRSASLGQVEHTGTDMSRRQTFGNSRNYLFCKFSRHRKGVVGLEACCRSCLVGSQQNDLLSKRL